MASKTSMRAITFRPGFRTQKRLILVSFVNAHMRICDAVKTGRLEAGLCECSLKSIELR